MAEGKQVESALLTEHFRYTPLVSYFPRLFWHAHDLFDFVMVSYSFGRLMLRGMF